LKGAVEGSRGQKILRETEIRDTALEKKHARDTRIGQILLGLFLFLLWEFGSGTLVDQFFVSKPSKILESVWSMLVKEELLYHMQFTVTEAVVGYAIGAGAGLLSGFLLARIDLVYRIVQPFIIGFYGIPRIALAPLFILWFGIGLSSKIAVAAVMVFFIVLINTIAGIRSVSAQLINVARVMGASEWDINWKVIFPSATPFIIAGLQIASPQAMIGAIVGEFISSNRGVGHLINKASGWLDTAGLFAGIFALMIVVLLMNYGVTKLGNRLMKWNPKYGGMREPV
jgi:NitT/TauT family transport system permease protein